MKKLLFFAVMFATGITVQAQSFTDLFTPTGLGNQIEYNTSSTSGYRIISESSSGSFTGVLAFRYFNNVAELSPTMVLNGSRVGIGTSNPAQKLHVQGYGYFSGRVGIGTSSPSTLLDIRNNSNPSAKIYNTSNGNWLDLGVSSCNSCFSNLSTDGDIVMRAYAGGDDLIITNQSDGEIIFGNGYSGSEVKRMVIDSQGNVGIGSANPDEKLTVRGTIHAEEVRIDLSVPADYVFQSYYTGTSALKSDYVIPTLEEVEAYTRKNHHLPNIPSAASIQENGLSVGEMTNLLLEKIEELTLYTIEQEKRIKTLELQISNN